MDFVGEAPLLEFSAKFSAQVQKNQVTKTFD